MKVETLDYLKVVQLALHLVPMSVAAKVVTMDSNLAINLVALMVQLLAILTVAVKAAQKARKMGNPKVGWSDGWSVDYLVGKTVDLSDFQMAERKVHLKVALTA